MSHRAFWQRRLPPVLLALGLVAVGCARATSTPSPSPTPTPTAFDEATVRRVVTLAQMWGHLEASYASAAANDWTGAAVHAAHPVGEYWALMERPLTDKGQAGAVRSSLDSYQQAVAAQAGNLAQPFNTAVGALQQAMSSLGSADFPKAAFQAQVVRELLEAVEEEYGEAVAEGAVRELVEYQDAWGFFRVAHTLYTPIAQQAQAGSTEAASEIQEELEGLEGVFATLKPTAAPAPVEEVKEAVGEVRAELAKAFYLAVGAPQGPQAVVAAIMEMMGRALEEYEEGERDEAYELAANAYLEGFEHIEGDLIQRGQGELVEKLEVQFKDLRDGVRAGGPLADLQALASAIEEGLEEALEVLQ